MERLPESTDPNRQRLGRYAKVLHDLKDYQIELGLESDPPKETVTIIPGTEGQGRPLGAQLPAYPQEECGTDEESIKKTLFNLASLANFKPPE